MASNRAPYRPPSLSESCARTPENIVRAQKEPFLAPTELCIDQETEPKSDWERTIVEICVKLSFHIALISIFETLFFFFFVSSLEDSGIQKTVQMFIHDAVNTCSNLTSSEIIIVDDVLEPYINASTIYKEAAIEYATRSAYNTILFNKAWIYVGSLSGLFVALILYTRIRKLALAWKKILLENLAMVILLALYEYMFFSTVISPYESISPQEIARNAVQQVQIHCGILT
jgi:hypothetical protein